MPQGILKPASRVGARPQTSNKTTSFAQNQNKDLKFFMEKKPTLGTLGSGDNEELDVEGSQAGEEGAEAEGEAPPPKAGIVVPNRKSFMNDKVTSSEQNVKDLNIPMESRSNYAYHVPTDGTAELQLEKRWRNAMHKKTIQKREKEEFVTLMKEWSHTKSRLEEEISRRNESNTFGSRYQKRAFIPRAKSAHITSALSSNFGSGSQINGASENGENAQNLDIKDADEISEKSQEHDQDEENEERTPEERVTVYRETGTKKVGRPEVFDFTHVRPKTVGPGQIRSIYQTEQLEDKVNKLRIERITKLHGDLVFGTRGVPTDVGQDGAYSVDRPTSLSIYDQSTLSKFRPFSAVHTSAKPENFRKLQMQEIEEVKEKLAKFKIKVPAKQLKTSLLLPELPPANVTKLPQPGAGLLMNPFYKEKKGKKKGKKKRK